MKVNNKQADANRILGNAFDAIGINSKVAERLSGADFDGDTVMIIPCNSSYSKVHITSTPPLKGLEGFDPKLEYGGKPKGTFKEMKNTQNEMGRISNLITDMTLKGATEDELARAVRHSMVVIDAEKHGLDYKQSEMDNGIAALRREYQGHVDEDGKYRQGASTLISSAKSEVSVLKRQGSPKVNQKGKEWYDPSKPEGALVYKTAKDLEYTDKNGKTRVRMQKSTRMAETDDARTLISDADTPIERAYADYANKMKSLANSARKEVMSTGDVKYNPSAKATYQKEVSSLNAKLNIAELNAPRERQAQIKANAVVKSTINAMKQENPAMTKAEVRAVSKKVGQQALTLARAQFGASGKDTKVKIDDLEWEAIQAGAISPSKLKRILNKTDLDSVKQRALPRTTTTLSTAKINRIKAMEASGHTIAEIADAMGISATTVSSYLK